jgi:leader peptidase (prepilin peptidase)/N-methyltransferase
MAIRTVFTVKSSTRMWRWLGRSRVAFSLLIMPLPRWLVAVHAVPATQEWRQSCPDCGTSLWPGSSGPSGRCRSCHTRPGAPAYLVEALVITAVALVAFANLPPWETVAATWWLGCAIVLGCVDVLVHRLPLRIIAAMYTGTTAFLTIGSGLGGEWVNLRRAIVVSVMLGIILFMFCLPKNGLGLGDAALAVAVGLALGWFGWPVVVTWVVVTSLLTGLTSLALLATRRVSWNSSLPLGPFMLAAVVLSVALR